MTAVTDNRASAANVLVFREKLARERQVDVRVVPTGKAVEESVDLAYEIYNRVFRKIPEILKQNEGVNL